MRDDLINNSADVLVVTNNLMSESAKNAITNKTANDTDDSKIVYMN
jgi:hypothetical protein